MPDDILDSRGRFWSADLTVPERHFAPDEAVTGRLRIGANGRAELDLDATLIITGSEDPVLRIMTRSSVEGAICGFLIDANKHVWLSDLSSNGGSLGGMGPARERLIADQCLVSREAFTPGAEPRFRWVDLPLDGFEEWLGRGNINVKSGRRRITADYARQKTLRWQAGAMPVELHRALEGDGGTGVTDINWRERSFLRLGFPKADLTIDQAIERAQRIEDLLVILADCNKGLDFFRLRRSRSGKPVQLYYARGGRSATDKVSWHKAWVRFEACADDFGDIVAAWLAKYEIYGPGFHLYLGNRRGQPLYPEHRFASLIWGLEALHRSMHPAESNAAQAAKVQRILEQIDKKKDRDWAERFLPAVSEPPLANRLQDLFSMLDLGIDRKQLAEFAQRCAARRNDVSHFGGVREPGGYDAFLDDILDLSRAIDLLYHALLLHLIGVPSRMVKHRLTGGLHSHAARQVLAHCGLDIPEHDVPAEPVPPSA
ncbi:MAG: HEPN domain-containing protein [Sphingomonas sp.]